MSRRWSSTLLTGGEDDCRWSSTLLNGYGNEVYGGVGVAVRLCRTVLSASEFAAGQTLANRRSQVRRPWHIWSGIRP